MEDSKERCRIDHPAAFLFLRRGRHSVRRVGLGIHKVREVVEMATKPDKFTLKPKQIRMAQKLADPGFTGTITELCDGIGVARTTFYDWMRI